MIFILSIINTCNIVLINAIFNAMLYTLDKFLSTKFDIFSPKRINTLCFQQAIIHKAVLPQA